MNTKLAHRVRTFGVAAAITLILGGTAYAQALPGGTIDPLSIPKYVTPLVIPPVMNNAGTDNDYDIAVRQFKQQILPGGIWNVVNGRDDEFPATPIWSYGPAAEDRFMVAGLTAPSAHSQFNYPAYTIEVKKDVPISVDWINDLVDPATGNYRPHLLPIDRTLHWANPEGLACNNPAKLTDCRPSPDNGAILHEPYTGPVPIVVHVHGSHVGPESDGYPEAWWLPDANNIPASYSHTGSLVNQYGYETNKQPGVASFFYLNDQPSTTLWYHDHALGMTRNNVYAGPAGFWLVREEDGGETGLGANVTLPGPAPVAGDKVLDLNIPGNPVRDAIREIPIVIQDRSFNEDGSLFYPANRAFFEGLGDGQDSAGNAAAGLHINFIGDGDSDIPPIWNPEAFFNVMVVNGVSWPELEVAPAVYRLRLLNGSNSRFLNLAMFRVGKKGVLDREVPFYQIGAEQSLMPQVVRIETGYATPLPGNGDDVRVKMPDCMYPNGTPVAKCVIPQAAPFAEQAMLMGLAERADVLVDFTNMKDGTVIRMINTAPDAPFGGFPDIPADPATTGQVMQFRVNDALLGASPTDPRTADGKPNMAAATKPQLVTMSLPDADDPAHTGIGIAGKQDLALLEEESSTVCVEIDAVTGVITQVAGHPDHMTGSCVAPDGTILGDAFPFAPKAAVLGTEGSAGGNVQLWADPIRQNPALGATEEWELWNWSADAHPIHLHLVKFKVVNREPFDPVTGDLLGPVPSSAHEKGWKDTVIAYPGEVTRLRATFDIPGLYVWHCHIVEHEDNEMMVPFCVGNDGAPGCSAHEATAAMQ